LGNSKEVDVLGTLEMSILVFLHYEYLVCGTEYNQSFVFCLRNSICQLYEFQSPLVTSFMNQVLLKVTFETQSQYDFNKQQLNMPSLVVLMFTVSWSICFS